MSVPPPELSIIIPAYNRQAGVERALSSVLDQGVDDIEVIVVDDCSSSPIQIPAKYNADSRIRSLRHSSNRGAAAARNTGMRAARGRWVAFLDSDDRWLPGTLARRVEWARKAAESGASPLLVYVAGFKFVDPNNARADSRIPVSSNRVLDFASGCWFSPGSTALFLREPILTRVGDQDERLRRFEDVDWFIRIALAGGGITTIPIIAAEIEVGAKPPLDVVQRDGGAVLQKYSGLNEYKIARQLKAWVSFESAAAYWHAGRYLGMLASLLQSWWFAPRWQLYLRKFWSK